MKDLKFIEGDPPVGYTKGFSSFLFNTSKHRVLQSPTDWISFHLIDEAGKKIQTSIHFHLKNDLAESPFKAPFGSIEFSNDVQPQSLLEFIRQVERHLHGKNIQKIIVRNPPQAYQPASTAIVESLLICSDYRISNAQINVSIDITPEPFDELIDRWELRKLNQARKTGLVFQSVSASSMDEIYLFIETCRKERNQSLSMTLAELRGTIEKFPDSFFLFAVLQDTEVIAASIAIKVSENIVYNFYSAHSRTSDALSPIVFLIDGLYGWCAANNVSMLDLGTSALGKVPNFGLLDFKLRLGGKPSVRYTFEKDLQ